MTFTQVPFTRVNGHTLNIQTSLNARFLEFYELKTMATYLDDRYVARSTYIHDILLAGNDVHANTRTAPAYLSELWESRCDMGRKRRKIPPNFQMFWFQRVEKKREEFDAMCMIDRCMRMNKMCGAGHEARMPHHYIRYDTPYHHIVSQEQHHSIQSRMQQSRHYLAFIWLDWTSSHSPLFTAEKAIVAK